MSEVSDIPRYTDLMLPTLQSVDVLGGSGRAREITDAVVTLIAADESLLQITYPNRPTKSILLDRMDWARSYCKLGGALESPRRGVFLLSPLGKEILALPESEAMARLHEIDRQVRAARKKPVEPSADEDVDVVDDEGDAVSGLDEELMATLYELSPTAFEEFCLYLLRECGLELRHVGGSGDEGIDGIGRAPISDVLSVTVAVQCKRRDPAVNKAVDRADVALFQRDAAAAGAERCIFVTLSRFSEPAKKAATQATPTVDLIDGQRLCELMRSLRIGIVEAVDRGWFARFEERTSG